MASRIFNNLPNYRYFVTWNIPLYSKIYRKLQDDASIADDLNGNLVVTELQYIR